ncbi:MAG TPA: DNA repair protein RadA, partial [Desulfuromonadales bacterium]|nr:DNA repair protein RadA [Desulfuromonadales bacterium]
MKQKTVFTCQKCGSQAHKWLGKCPDCGSWNSMVEESAATSTGGRSGGQARPIPICDVPPQSET